jgi:hypothetical protein
MQYDDQGGANLWPTVEVVTFANATASSNNNQNTTNVDELIQENLEELDLLAAFDGEDLTLNVTEEHVLALFASGNVESFFEAVSVV